MAITPCGVWGTRQQGVSPNVKAAGIRKALFQPLFQGNSREKGLRRGMG